MLKTKTIAASHSVFLMAVVFFSALAQAQEPAVSQVIFPPPSKPADVTTSQGTDPSVSPSVNADSASTNTVDPSLTTHEAAVECAMALIVESAGERHAPLGNPAANGFKAGICTGKIQTYMLEAQAANSGCFPKIELEEGMRMFVKWAEAHPEEGALLYTEGMKKAFEDSVPCLKK